MSGADPISALPTHRVENQPPPLADYNLYGTDRPLREAVEREGAGWAEDRLTALGAEAGRAAIIEKGYQANRHPPELRAFDSHGRRIDEIEYHPAYHDLMALGIGHDVHAIAWSEDRAGSHVAHVALEYLLTQAEAGVCCPITMTYASVPAINRQPEIAERWLPKILSRDYDPRPLPMAEKAGVTIGMAMTEKQGGSDVQRNTTRAAPAGNGGPGGEYRLTGHKWFCSAPMCDAFLTLAQTEAGLSCFFVPRWLEGGERNPFFIQRLKDKCGNRSNASAEIDYHDTRAWMIGEDGRGVRTIMEMVQHTRLDAGAAPVGMMRQALVQAIHHCRHREAFGERLIGQPLMRNVLADMALDCEGAVALIMRVARAVDEAARGDDAALALSRLGVAITKFWTNKRFPALSVEAMECLGGNGYVEESMMPRLYREAPVNSIWEGSGNVLCLDVLRVMERHPDMIGAFVAELEEAEGMDGALDSAIGDLKSRLADPGEAMFVARRIVERMVLCLQGALLCRHAPAPVAGAFCATRLGGDWGRTYGSLPADTDFDAILARADPEA